MSSSATASPAITLLRTQETFFFRKINGRLCQQVLVTARYQSAGAVPAQVTITAQGQTITTPIVLQPGEMEYACHGPALWPAPGIKNARLTLTVGKQKITRPCPLGQQRPWTLYLLSDICTDDTWSYEDLQKHDADEAATTRNELMIAPDNAYNLPATYQAQRFVRAANKKEMHAYAAAIRSGRLHVSPVPTQFLCGSVSLSAYPLMLEPYRRLVLPYAGKRSYLCGHHMEAPNWSNGLVELLADAGFNVFAKSMLWYLSPWLKRLQELPRLVRLEHAPGRYAYLVFRAEDYFEGKPMMEGLDKANVLLHEKIIPSYVRHKDAYPGTAIAIFGIYSDLSPKTQGMGATKLDLVRKYNAQGWEYPKLVNASWNHLSDHLQRELGDPAKPKWKKIVTVRGDAGSSWEMWPTAVQTEHAAFRAAQRQVVSLHSLAVLAGRGREKKVQAHLAQATQELVYLTDHAWNGHLDYVRNLNTAIRRRRLGVLNEELTQVRESFLPAKKLKVGRTVGVVNTLGWARACPVNLPAELTLEDPQAPAGAAPLARTLTGQVLVPQVPAFGMRVMRVVKAAKPAAQSKTSTTPAGKPPFVARETGPVLRVEGQDQTVTGGWRSATQGKWRAGPFAITCRLQLQADATWECLLDVAGKPPATPYELRFDFRWPWDKCVWRGESGGGFITPGHTKNGGDSLLGVVGSVFGCGEALSVAEAPASGRGRAGLRGRRRIDIALEQTGLCGPGERTSARAFGKIRDRSQPLDITTYLDEPVTQGRLYWYLLGTAQNVTESFLDQAGGRRWQFRCHLRASEGHFDDAALYRYGCAQNYAGELVDPEKFPLAQDTLRLRAADGVLPLTLWGQNGAIEMDFYNTGKKPATIGLAGKLVAGRTLTRADMLGRPAQTKGLTVPPRGFAKVTFRPGK